MRANEGADMGPPHLQTAAALIRRDHEILLVKQQGGDDAVPTWALPGGVVEPGELPTNAMVREVKEETGIDVTDLGRLLYVKAGVDPSGQRSSTTYVFEVQAWQGVLRPAAPEDPVIDARFLPLTEAIAALEQLPSIMMREPILAHLHGDVLPGALWLYHFHNGGSATLIDVVGSRSKAGRAWNAPGSPTAHVPDDDES